MAVILGDFAKKTSELNNLRILFSKLDQCLCSAGLREASSREACAALLSEGACFTALSLFGVMDAMVASHYRT